MVKGSDYHENITKMVFSNSSVNDLIWRRLIKISMLNFKNDPLNSAIWSSEILKPLIQPLDYDQVVFADFNIEAEKNKGVNPGVYIQPDSNKEVMPDESMSTIMENMGLGVALKALNKSSMNTNTAMLEDYNRKPKVFDYKIDDFYFKPNNQRFLAFVDTNADNNPGKKDPKKVVIDEFGKLNANEEYTMFTAG